LTQRAYNYGEELTDLEINLAQQLHMLININGLQERAPKPQKSRKKNYKYCFAKTENIEW